MPPPPVRSPSVSTLRARFLALKGAPGVGIILPSTGIEYCRAAAKRDELLLIRYIGEFDRFYRLAFPPIHMKIHPWSQLCDNTGASATAALQLQQQSVLRTRTEPALFP